MILVTGGTGLVGGHLIAQLYKRGEKIRAIKRPHSSHKELHFIASYYGIEATQLEESIEWVFGDLLNIPSIEKALEGVDAVFHCAAIVSFNRDQRNSLLQTNIQGTRTLCELSLQMEVKSFAMVSSIAAIGDTIDRSESTEESNSETIKDSYYAQSKSAAEKIVWEYISKGLPAYIVNPGIILGVGFPTKGSLRLVNQVFKGLSFYTEGTTGYVDVEDVVTYMIAGYDMRIVGERYVLVAENISYKDLFTQLATNLHVHPPRYHANILILILGVFFSWLFQWIIGGQSITIETAKSAIKHKSYNSSKAIHTFGINFIPFDQTIRKSAESCINYYTSKP